MQLTNFALEVNYDPCFSCFEMTHTTTYILKKDIVHIQYAKLSLSKVYNGKNTTTLDFYNNTVYCEWEVVWWWMGKFTAQFHIIYVKESVNLFCS